MEKEQKNIERILNSDLSEEQKKQKIEELIANLRTEKDSLTVKISDGVATDSERERYKLINGLFAKTKKDVLEEKVVVQEDFNLEELADMMTPEEMNAILIMKDSGNSDDSILNNISTRLDVPISKLEEIAVKKEVKLKEQEKDKEVEEGNNTNDNSAASSDGSSSDNDNQEKIEDEKKENPKLDTQLDKPSGVTGIGVISNRLKSIVNAKSAMAVAAIVSAIAILSASPLAMGYAALAGAGKIYMDYSKGKK